MEKQQQIVIFGGSFNPPTIAHEQIMSACLSLPDFDEVWVMPSGQREDKHITCTDEVRMEMLRTLHQGEFESNPRLVISDFELRLPRPTRTVQTIGALALAHPDKKFWFVFGADSYENMTSWEGGEMLRANLPMLLVSRKDNELPEVSANIRHLPGVTDALAGMSSTQVREAVKRHRDVSGFVSNTILRHITNQGLYAY